jgi:hypothetical protein
LKEELRVTGCQYLISTQDGIIGRWPASVADFYEVKVYFFTLVGLFAWETGRNGSLIPPLQKSWLAGPLPKLQQEELQAEIPSRPLNCPNISRDESGYQKI